MKHLDEGTIHAWLDGELRDDADDVERHVASCAECAARVAEARGLIAGASRILSALDDVGVGIVPERPAAVTRSRRRRWVRPVSWLAAAGLIVAVGVKTVGRGTDSLRDGQTDSQTVGQSKGRTDSTAMKVAEAPSADVGRTVEPANRRAVTTKPTNAPSEASSAANAAEVAKVAAAAAPPVVRDSVSRMAAGVAAPAPPAAAAVLDSAARLARMQEAAKSVQLGQIVTTSVGQSRQAARDAMTSAQLGQVPLCFAELRQMPVPALADAQRAGAPARADVAAMGGAAAVANALRARFASNVLMLDAAPVSAVHTIGEVPRLLRDSSGVVGEWARLGPDSVVLRFGGNVVRGVVAAEGIRFGGSVLARTECGTIRP